MSTNWKSTINHAYTSPGRLHPILQQTIPALIKDEIQRLANLVLFQNNVQSRSTSSQVPVDMKFTDDSLNIRISKNAPWISLLPSSEPMSPEERAVDAVRRDVMEKIALLWGGISSDSSSNESESEDRETFRSSTRRSTKGSERTRSKRSKRAEKNKRMSGHKEPFTNISRNKIDCSTHTTNNYYCCVGSHDETSHKRKEKPGVLTTDMSTQTDRVFNPVFKYQNHRTDRETGSSNDSSSDESDHSSTSSFSSKSSKHLDTDSSEDSSDDELDYNSTSSFSSKSSRDKLFSNDLDIDTSEDLIAFPDDESEQDPTEPLLHNTQFEDRDLITFPDDEPEQDPTEPLLHNTQFDDRDLITFPDDELEQDPTEPLLHNTQFEDRDLITFPDDESERDPTEPLPHNTQFEDRDLITFPDDEPEQDPTEPLLHNTQFEDRDLMTFSDDELEQDPTEPLLHNTQFEDRDLITFPDFDNRSEHSSTSYFTADSEIAEDFDVSDKESELSYHTAINDELEEKKFSPSMQKRNFVAKEFNTESMPRLRPIPSKTGEPFVEIKKFIQTYDTESKPVSHIRALIELQVELAQEKPDRGKINNLLSILGKDSLQIPTEVLTTKAKKFVSLDKIVSGSELQELHTFLENSIEETKAFIEIANSVEKELTPQTISSLLRNRDIFTEIQDLVDLDPQLATSSDRVNSLLDQLDLNTLQLIHNSFDLEIPYLNRDDSSDDESTIIESEQTAYENESSASGFIDDEVTDQPIPTFLSSNESDLTFETVFTKEQETNTEQRSAIYRSSNTVDKNLRTTSTETDLGITTPKTTQGTQAVSVSTDQDMQTDSVAVSRREQETNTEQRSAIDRSSNTVDKNLRTNSTETDLGITTPKTTQGTQAASVTTDQDIQTDSVAVSRKDQATNTEQSSTIDSSSNSTSIGPEETEFKNKSLVSGFIDDEITDQPIPTFMRVNTFNDEDDLDNLLNSTLFTNKEESDNEVKNASIQTDPYISGNEFQLQERLQKLETVLERTKSIHKDEVASLLRAQDRLQAGANQKIQETLKSSIKSEHAAFSRLQESNERYKRLLEDTVKEIATLRKSLAKLEAVDTAKKTEFDNFRSTVYSPTPEVRSKAEKIETKNQSTQVEEALTPPKVNAKGTTRTANPDKTIASSSKFNQHERDLAVISIQKLRKQKAALEISKSNRPETKALLKKIDDELIRRNQSKQKNEKPLVKKSLNQSGRNRLDLGKEVFTKEQHNLNWKRTNNK